MEPFNIHVKIAEQLHLSDSGDTPIDDLPDEILTLILSHNPRDLSDYLLTNKKWNRIGCRIICTHILEHRTIGALFACNTPALGGLTSEKNDKIYPGIFL